jgi:hypothetical protein
MQPQIAVVRPLIALCAILLAGCSTHYGDSGFLGGAVATELGPGKYEIKAIGRSRTDYKKLASLWHRKARRLTVEEGGTSYETLKFYSGREVLGFQALPEGTHENVLQDTVFWTPKVISGVIQIR